MDDGMGVLVCAQSGASALIPRPSAVYPREDAPRPDLMAAVMRTVCPTCWCRVLMLQGALIRIWTTWDNCITAPLFVLVCDA
jgi:hypothetical protein